MSNIDVNLIKKPSHFQTKCENFLQKKKKYNEKVYKEQKSTTLTWFNYEHKHQKLHFCSLSLIYV